MTESVLSVLMVAGAVAAIGLALAVGLLVFQSRSRPPSEREVELERAGFEVRRSWYLPKVRGRHASVAFQHFICLERSKPRHFVVSIPSRSPGEFRVVPVSRLDRLAAALGLDKRVQTGDAALDAQYWISGSDESYVRQVFRDRENVQRLRTLVATRCNELYKEPTELFARGPGREYLPATELKTVVEQLATFRLPTVAY